MTTILVFGTAWALLSATTALFLGKVIALRDRHETPVPKRADWNHS